MSVSDEEFAEWLKQDNRDRVVLIEVDYKYESAGAPATGTVRIANKVYFDIDAETTYDDALLAAPRFARALSGERLGNYELSLGSVEIANPDGTYDSLLTRAVDGNEVRAYLGDGSWARADFRLIFSARATIPVAPQVNRVSIQLRDASALLNKSVAGTSTVGGTGPHKDRLRPVNFGFVRQVECLVLDEGTLTFVHSDTGVDTYVIAVRDRGIDIAFVDNGDGTITLPVAPDGAVVADILAVSSDDPGDFTYRKVSDAFKALIGERAGFIAASKYLGAGFTFIEGDVDDYLVGITLPEARNVVELLNAIVDTGNCFWAMTREGKFTFGRLNPHNIEDLLGSPLAVVDIEADDIDHGSLRVDHASTKYYKFQAYMSKNWSLPSDDLATSLTPEERALRTRKGLYYMQPDTEGTTYADAPQLYSLSLEVSPPIETYLSAGYAEDELPVIERWALQRKMMFQPWVEVVSCTVGIEFYALELGDIVRLTLDRFDLGEQDGGGSGTDEVLVSSYLFRSNFFNGSAGDDLTENSPDVGGAYALSGTGSLTNYVLDGFGNVLGTFDNNQNEATSTFDGAPGATYSLYMSFFGVADTPASSLGLSAINSSNVHVAEAQLDFAGSGTGVWTLTTTVRDDGGSVLFTDVVDVSTKMGVDLGYQGALYINVTAAGTEFRLSSADEEAGAVETFATTSEVPGTPDRIGFFALATGASTITVHYLVAVAFASAATSGTIDYFTDEFSGTGDFTSHLPDLSDGAYADDGGGLNNLLLDGSGLAYGNDNGAYSYSPFGGVPVSDFSMRVGFSIGEGDLDSGSFIDIALVDDSFNWLVEPFVFYDGSELRLTIFDGVGSPGFDVAVAQGAHEILFESSLFSTRWYLDDVLVFERPGFDTTTLSKVEVGLGNAVGSTAVKLDYVRVASPNMSVEGGGGAAANSLLQVVGVDIRLTEAKVGLQLMRRRASGEIPDDFSPTFVEEDAIETGLLVPILPPPEPPLPPTVPPGPPGGGGGPSGSIGTVDMSGPPAGPFVDRWFDRPPDFHGYVAGTVGKAYTFYSTHTVALTPDSGYMVVGNPIDESGGGSNIRSGIVHVLKRASDGTYSQVATITRITGGGGGPSGTDLCTGWGSIVDINANLDIFVGTIQPGSDAGVPFTGNNARIYEYTGSDTWDSGTDLGFSACDFAHFAKWPAAAVWSTQRTLVAYHGWSGSSAVPLADRVHIWRRGGSVWTDAQTLTLHDEGSGYGGIRDAAVTFDGRTIAVYYSTSDGINFGAWVECWRTNDNITWNSVDYFQVGATDGPSGGPIELNNEDCIAISGDARVIVIANSFGVRRGGTDYGAVYIFRAQGTAIWPNLGAYQQKALLLGSAANSIVSIALSFDGQYLVAGDNFSGGGFGALWGVNRVQALAGERFLTSTPYAYAFTHPFPSNQYSWATSIAMDFNGRTVAAQIGNAYAGTPTTLVRLFNNTLDDHIAGITNDDWQDAIDFTPGIFVQNALLPAVKIGAANMELGETLSSGSVHAQSLWYKITPLVNALLSVDTLISTTPLDPFYPNGYPQTTKIDTTIGLYTGASVDALTEVDYNDDWAGGVLLNPLSKLEDIPLTALTTYYLRVQPAQVYDADFPLLTIRYSYLSSDVIFDDSLTDTNGVTLDAHAPEIGGAWELLPGTSEVDDGIDSTEIQSNAAINPTNQYGLAVSTNRPSFPDYYVECVVRFANTGNSNFNALLGARCTDPDGFGASAGYILQLGFDFGFGWRMIIWNANTGATIGGAAHTFSPDLNYGQDYALRLHVEGTSIKGYLDGVQILSITDSTFTSAGRAGWLCWTDSVIVKSVHAEHL